LAPDVDGIETAGTNGTPFKDLRRQVLMEAALSPVSSNATHAFLGDHLKLRAACAKLTVEAGNKRLDLVTRRRIQGMLGLLNLHLDEGLMLSWRKASVVVSKAQGHGDTHVRRIHEWTLAFVQRGALLIHHLGQACWTVLHE